MGIRKLPLSKGPYDNKAKVLLKEFEASIYSTEDDFMSAKIDAWQNSIGEEQIVPAGGAPLKC